MNIVRWTGSEARALRLALRMSQRTFSSHLGVNDAAVSHWEKRGEDAKLRYETQQMLDTTLAQAGDAVHRRFTELLGQASASAADRLPLPEHSRSRLEQELSARVDPVPRVDHAGCVDSDESDRRGTIEEGTYDQVVGWLDRRDFLAVAAGIALGAGNVASGSDWDARAQMIEREAALRRVGMADVERVEATTEAFRMWDMRWGGGVSRAAVVAQLDWVVATAKTAIFSSEGVRHRLLAATADLAKVAAFMSYDVERHDDARRLWLLALDACRGGSNAGLAAATLRDLAHQALHLNRPHEALGLVGLAYTTDDYGNCGGFYLGRAETAAYHGWCYAAVGDTQACHRAFGQAEEIFATTSVDDVPQWLGYFDYSELVALKGHAYHVLADTVPHAATQAQPLLREAVAARPPSYVRSRTLNLIALSATYFQAGENLEEGVMIGRQALEGARELTSPRSLSRLDGLRTTVEPFANASPAAEFHDELREVLADAA